MRVNTGNSLLVSWAIILVSICTIGSNAQEDECVVRFSQSKVSNFTKIQVKDQVALINFNGNWTAFVTKGDTTMKFPRDSNETSTELSDQDKQLIESMKGESDEAKGVRWTYANGRLMVESTDNATMSLRSNGTGSVTLSSEQDESIAILNLASAESNFTHVIQLNGSVVVLVDKDCSQVEVMALTNVTDEVKILIGKKEEATTEEQKRPPHCGPNCCPPCGPHCCPPPPPPPHHGPHPPPPPPHHGPHPPPPPPHHGPHPPPPPPHRGPHPPPPPPHHGPHPPPPPPHRGPHPPPPPPHGPPHARHQGPGPRGGPKSGDSEKK